MDFHAILGDTDRLQAAVAGRDARFDGWVFLAVTSTRIYCRPSCPAVKPKREHQRFYASAAAAQDAGYRACKRCRPDASPGSPAWDWRSDVCARAMRLIGEGVVDRDGAAGLAARLGYSLRQLERLLIAEVGAGPAALARAQRAQVARTLIESTDLPMGQVAFAAGFASIRAFNRVVADVFACSPTELRAKAKGRTAPGGGAITLRLAYREPFEPSNLFGHLAAAAAPGVEEWSDGAYRRTLRLPHGPGTAALRPGPGYIECRLRVADLRDVTAAVARCRRALDLDADPHAPMEALTADPVLAPLVAKTPGRRVPRKADGPEYALRAVIGQQIATASAATVAARLAERYGEPVEDPDGGLTRLFPSPAALAEADPAHLPMPARRKATVLGLAAALAQGRVDVGPGADWAKARQDLAGVPGVGPWTIEMIAMRALGDPDAFPVKDLGVVKGARHLDLGAGKALEARSQAWRPWRAYAVQYLWASSEHPTNHLPTDTVKETAA
ncbi:DNA-3-methyladenine glycosylase 2 family protein [Glycomyces niveus]|jgi:AraC family transcriptional regulator of adaptative response / DNA-3-methyladenine glycosylase II|uniref:DNA-3-methyladenine glycosylase II n=1 Tax=Glycomyces niveus TaxID=2820287 RepID=A0ABS3U0B5_9ACTN|nr:AlkA N-terminal domain-containing protein [Glycomyces sp. NEAU-S30]MBO3732207.1 DNA-3-methyladenine glycosylase 2 family protein [Glycomyces sp. NEAU-S30]